MGLLVKTKLEQCLPAKEVLETVLEIVEKHKERKSLNRQVTWKYPCYLTINWCSL